ncbi:MAG TPA: prepilin-type N-terminal cleavage/methylation domain-containing protein [Planctomycetes bacterium]|nr:prepilin-type N-terminal cleavage/methylation domain-containing protein [Planctomycetota bacterium]HIJ70990.1 prepilin-type N-terminal cleavage/methylation domain-containing protein [Planctomycetota bacterium]
MRTDKSKTGFTLVELLTVVSVMLLLAVLGLPAAKQVLDSFESSLSVRHLISSALGNARAIAAREQAYSGLRFQQDLAGNQYMIFIINDPAPSPSAADLANDPTLTGTGLANGFRAVTGCKPARLPANVGVMDLMVRSDPCDAGNVGDRPIVDADLNNSVSGNLVDGRNIYLTDTTSFSIVFSPSGKLVIHEVRTRNRHGRFESNENVDWSKDGAFNTLTKITDAVNQYGMFVQDDYAERGLGQELSRNSFVIYDKRRLDLVSMNKRWTDYLQYLEVLYISPYTGRIINK